MPHSRRGGCAQPPLLDIRERAVAVSGADVIAALAAAASPDAAAGALSRWGVLLGVPLHPRGGDDDMLQEVINGALAPDDVALLRPLGVPARLLVRLLAFEQLHDGLVASPPALRACVAMLHAGLAVATAPAYFLFTARLLRRAGGGRREDVMERGGLMTLDGAVAAAAAPLPFDARDVACGAAYVAAGGLVSFIAALQLTFEAPAGCLPSYVMRAALGAFGAMVACHPQSVALVAVFRATRFEVYDWVGDTSGTMRQLAIIHDTLKFHAPAAAAADSCFAPELRGWPEPWIQEEMVSGLAPARPRSVAAHLAVAHTVVRTRSVLDACCAGGSGASWRRAATKALELSGSLYAEDAVLYRQAHSRIDAHLLSFMLVAGDADGWVTDAGAVCVTALAFMESLLSEVSATRARDVLAMGGMSLYVCTLRGVARALPGRAARAAGVVIAHDVLLAADALLRVTHCFAASGAALQLLDTGALDLVCDVFVATQRPEADNGGGLLTCLQEAARTMSERIGGDCDTTDRLHAAAQRLRHSLRDAGVAVPAAAAAPAAAARRATHVLTHCVRCNGIGAMPCNRCGREWYCSDSCARARKVVHALDCAEYCSRGVRALPPVALYGVQVSHASDAAELSAVFASAVSMWAQQDERGEPLPLSTHLLLVTEGGLLEGGEEEEEEDPAHPLVVSAFLERLRGAAPRGAVITHIAAEDRGVCDVLYVRRRPLPLALTQAHTRARARARARAERTVSHARVARGRFRGDKWRRQPLRPRVRWSRDMGPDARVGHPRPHSTRGVVPRRRRARGAGPPRLGAQRAAAGAGHRGRVRARRRGARGARPGAAALRRVRRHRVRRDVAGGASPRRRGAAGAAARRRQRDRLERVRRPRGRLSRGARGRRRRVVARGR